MVFVLSTASTDISVGQVMYVTGVICGLVLEKFRDNGLAGNGWAILVVWLVGLCIGAVFGAFNGLLVGKFGIVSFIVTLATMSIARGLGLIISRSKVYYMSELSPFSQSVVGPIRFPVVVILQLVMVLIFAFLYRKTPFGRHIDAVGNDEAAAKSVGINTARVKFLAFLLCGHHGEHRRAAAGRPGGERLFELLLRQRIRRDLGGGARRHEPLRRQGEHHPGRADRHRADPDDHERG